MCLYVHSLFLSMRVLPSTWYIPTTSKCNCVSANNPRVSVHIFEYVNRVGLHGLLSYTVVSEVHRRSMMRGEVRWRRGSARRGATVATGIIGARCVNPAWRCRIGVEGTRIRTVVRIRIGHVTETWVHSSHAAHTAHPVSALHQTRFETTEKISVR